jgi:hypothetical protein
VSETVSRGPEAGQKVEVLAAETVAPAGVRASAGAKTATGARAVGRRRRSGLASVGVAVVLGAGAVAGWRAGVFSAAASSGAGQRGAASATAAVVREDLSATTPVAATLGYAGSYTVRGQGGGTLTSLPRAGQVIRQGQMLYQTGNGSPVVLLYGAVPAWRTLSEGVTGADVTQLNHDLAALGDANRAQLAAAGWDCYSAETAYAVQQLEEHLGVSAPSGSLSLGQVVFEPNPIRVTLVPGVLGGPASGPVLVATSVRHVVTIPLDVSQESEVKTGDRVTVTLPDGTTTPGVVSSVGTVATSTSGQNGTVTTIPVQVRLTDSGAAGSLDQAPVTVNITTETARAVLAVPVTALLAHSPGGYVVEVAGRGGTRRYVPVTPGIFDGVNGLVQVAGDLTPGQRVVVASS